ncbi:hypothetical protein ES703_110494 [subsurface metagenome]
MGSVTCLRTLGGGRSNDAALFSASSKLFPNSNTASLYLNRDSLNITRAICDLNNRSIMIAVTGHTSASMYRAIRELTSILTSLSVILLSYKWSLNLILNFVNTYVVTLS